MADINTLFAQAEQHYANRRYKQAADLLQGIARQTNHVAVFHLLGLAERERGDLAAASAALLRAATLAPTDAHILNNLGNVCADRKDWPGAVASFQRAIACAPDWPDARLNLALTLEQSGRPVEARDVLMELVSRQPKIARAWSALGKIAYASGALDGAAAAYDEALALKPDHPPAVRGRAQVALERGEEAALRRFEALAAIFPGDRDVAIGWAEARLAAGRPDALTPIDAILGADPDWPEGHAIRARMLWESGEHDTFTDGIEASLTKSPRNRALWTSLVDALAGVDRFAAAADAAHRARTALAGDAEFSFREAIHAGEAQDHDRAEKAFALLPRQMPGRPVHEARHRIRRGEHDRAEQLLSTAIAADAGDVSAWALMSVVWRLSGNPRNDWLHRQPGLVGLHALGLSEAELQETADFLRGLHRTNTFPIGQSLRGGTQTRGRLLARTEPMIVRLREALEAAVHDHWRALPPEDRNHPLLRHRAADPLLAGSWSVRLTDAGFHVAHIHPQGLLSSASYYVVPAGDSRQGWLELGRPPADLGLALEPVEIIEPLPGRLILFPSTLHHGTRPFHRGERITVAFDVIGWT